MRNKRKYHPAIWLAYYLQILPAEMLLQIPRTTLQHRKTSTPSKLYGYDWYMCNKHLIDSIQLLAINKNLQQTVYVLIRVIAIKKFIQQNSLDLKHRVQRVVNVVINNIQKLTERISLKQCLKLLQLDTKYYYRLRSKSTCYQSLWELCLKRHPYQLVKEEIETIKRYMSDKNTEHWYASSIFQLMKRNGDASFSERVFYKYVNKLKCFREKPKRRDKRHKIGIRSHAPLELLHVDISYFECENMSRNYIYVIRDNFSRAILHASASNAIRASHWKQILEETLTIYKCHLPKTITIMSDGGSENSSVGCIHNPLSDKHTIKHIVAGIQNTFSNSMVEYAHYLIKYTGLYHYKIPDLQALQKILPSIVDDINNRPSKVLNAHTPNEVLHNIQVKLPPHTLPNPIEYA